MPRIQISAHLETLIEEPAGDTKVPAVVILHEWWGVNEQIGNTAQRWAAEGALAYVPDLYHGKLAGSAEEATSLMKALDLAAALQEIAQTVDHAREHPRCNGKVVVTGYCMGGALTFAAATHIRGLAGTVPFYGLRHDQDWSKVDAPIQAHFAQHDDWATVAGAQKIKDAVPVAMELHVYDAQHAFCNERRPEVFNADAAREAWGRAVAFVRQHAL